MINHDATNHDACPRCTIRCQHRSWPDRHPAAAVTAGLFTLTLMSMMLSVYPVAGAAVVVLLGLAGFAVLVDRERQRREACAARAERGYRLPAELLVNYDHGRQAATVRPPRPRQPAPWHVVSLLPTEPLRAGRN